MVSESGSEISLTSGSKASSSSDTFDQTDNEVQVRPHKDLEEIITEYLRLVLQYIFNFLAYISDIDGIL